MRHSSEDSSPGRKKGRRRSWLQGTNILAFFRSAPPSPVRESVISKQRSHSVGAADSHTLRDSAGKSALTALLSKTKRSCVKRSTTEPHIDHMLSSSEPPSAASSRNNSFSVPAETPLKRQSLLLEANEDEVDRLQLKNDLVKLAFEEEFQLPIDFGKTSAGQILDVGCGPGAWCIDMAKKYPNVQVIGVDSESMFPDQSSIPPNCSLLVYDALNGLGSVADTDFDIIQIRFMSLSFTTEQYQQVLLDCWQLLKPGGYIEILETDMILCSVGPTTARINDEIVQMTQSKGFKPYMARQMVDMIPKGGRVLSKYRSLPIGLWGGRLGVLCRDDLVHILKKCQPAVRAFYGRPNTEHDDDEFNTRLEQVCREMDQYHSYSNFHFVTVQKCQTSPSM